MAQQSRGSIRVPWKRASRAVIAAAAAAMMIAGMTACTASSSSSDTKHTLRIAAASAPNGMNPVLNGNGIPTSWFFMPAYDSLIVHKSDGSFAPGLAAKFGYADASNEVFQLTLKKGIKFSDGETLDAAALKKWLGYFLGTSIFKGQFTDVKGVDIVDPLTVQIHLGAPNSLWPFFLSQDRFGLPISPKAIDHPDVLGSETDGAGPYQLDKAATVTGQTYVYKPVKNYWNKSAQKWGEIDITVMNDANAALSAMQSGQIDFLIGQARSAQTAKNAGINVKPVSYLWNSLMLLDRAGETVPALGDVRVRQALNYAVDRAAIQKAVFGDFGAPNASMLVKGFQGYSDANERRYTQNLDKARELLKEAGYANGFELPVLVWNRNGTDETTFAQALQGQLAKIGVSLKLISATDPSTILGDLLAKKYPAFVFFGQISEPNLLVFEQLQPGSGVLNPYKTTDDQLLGLWKAAMSASPADLPAALKAVQARIVDQGYYLQVSVSDNVYFYSKGVTGVDVSNAQPIINLLSLAPAN